MDVAYDELETGVVGSDDMALASVCRHPALTGLLPPLADPCASVAQLVATFARNNFGVLNDLLTVVGAGLLPYIR